MAHWFQPRIRHPFFPRLIATPAAEARGRVVALSGAFQDLEKAARAGASAQRALFVMNRWHEDSLTNAQRDLLWRLFQVPVYTLLVDSEDHLVGYECEAQRGFHVPGKSADGSRLCECGRPGILVSMEAANGVVVATTAG